MARGWTARAKPTLEEFKALNLSQKQREMIDVIFGDEATDESLEKLYEAFLKNQ